jgi:hypothetical protein
MNIFNRFNILPGIIGLTIGIITSTIGVGIALAIIFGFFLFPNQQKN